MSELVTPPPAKAEVVETMAEAIKSPPAPVITLADLWSLLRATGEEWIDDKAGRLAAALAYYTVFSIPPLLVIAIAVAGEFYGADAARNQVYQQLDGIVGPTAAGAIQNILLQSREPSSNLIATLVGVATLIFGASAVFAELQDAMNTIWDAKPAQRAGWIEFLYKRFFSFLMVVGIGILLLALLVVSTVITTLVTYFREYIPYQVFLVRVVELSISFATIAMVFAFIYKKLPDVRIAWSDVWLGAMGTALLFTLGKFLIGLYLGRTSIASTYGAAGSLAVILLWVYYSAQILFFGAEFTQVYAYRFGTKSAKNLPEHKKERKEQARVEGRDLRDGTGMAG